MEHYRSQFEANNARVLAINPASIKAHKRYAEKEGFKFPILSDPGEKVLIMYQGQKDSGKGVFETVYGLDPLGKIILAGRGQASYKDVLARIKSYG